MGTILSRYIFRQTAGSLLLILLSLSGMVWIALALKQLNLVTTQGQETWLLFKMTLLALPNLMALIAPLALLVAAIHVLNRLNSDSEMIVASAAGATVWNAARPLLTLALLVSIAVSLVNHFGMPWSLRLLRDYVIQVRTDLITQVIQPGRFSSPENNLTFHIRDRSTSGELLGLIMHDARDDKQVVTFLAERGRIIKQDSAAYLLMEAGHILRRSGAKDPVQIVAFDRYAMDLAGFEQKDDGFVLKPRERYFSELINPDPSDLARRQQIGHLRAELHERFSSPLYPFAFVLIAIAFVGQAQTTRQNRVESMVLAFMAAAALRLAGMAATNWVTLRASAVPVVYALPIFAIVLATAVAHRRMRPRQSSKLAQMLVAAWQAVLATVSELYRRLRPRRLRPAWSLATNRLLRRYVAGRFLLLIGATFALCCVLIFMIDMVELLRQAGKYGRVPTGSLAWLALLRLPTYTEALMPFCVMAGSIGALMLLGRKSELIVMRASGMSVWQFLAPGIFIAFVIGVLAALAYSPLVAASRSEADRLFAEVFGREVHRAESRRRWRMAASGRDRWGIRAERRFCCRGRSNSIQRDACSIRSRGALRRAGRRRESAAVGRVLADRQGASRQGRTGAGVFRHLYGQHVPAARASCRCLGLGHGSLVLGIAWTDRSGGKVGAFGVPVSRSVRASIEPPAAAHGNGPFGCHCVFAVIPRGWDTDYGNHRNARGIWLLSPLGGLSADWNCRARAAGHGGVDTGVCRVLWIVNSASPPGGRLS